MTWVAIGKPGSEPLGVAYGHWPQRALLTPFSREPGDRWACEFHGRCTSGLGTPELLRTTSLWCSALGGSAKRPLEWGLWGVTLGTAALCWGCCSCLGVTSHSPLCLKGHPESRGALTVGLGVGDHEGTRQELCPQPFGKTDTYANMIAQPKTTQEPWWMV